jgi:hypothetical protein
MPALVRPDDLKFALIQTIDIGLGMYLLYLSRLFPTFQYAPREAFDKTKYLSHLFFSICAGSFLVNSIKRNMIVNFPSSKNSNRLVHWALSPQGHTVSFISGIAGSIYNNTALKMAGFLSSSCYIYAVGKNSYSGLKRCFQQIRFRPLSAIGAASIHLLNLGLELGSAATQFFPNETLNFSDRASFCFSENGWKRNFENYFSKPY